MCHRRKNYVAIAENLRVLDLPADVKAKAAADLADALDGSEGFNALRFIAHATSTDTRPVKVGPGKWERNGQDAFPAESFSTASVDAGDLLAQAVTAPAAAVAVSVAASA